MQRVFGAGILFCILMGSAYAQGLLYDPEPPTDSAYVRVIAVSSREAMNVQVDGKARGSRIEQGMPSDYMVIPAGKHTLILSTADHHEPKYTATLDVIAGRAMTVAFTSEDAKVAPQLFEDHANANKLKAVLAVYPLAQGMAGLDIRSADGKVSVFKALVPGAMRTITVNPIKIKLGAFQEALSLATMSLDMAPGGTYSIMLLPAPHDGLKAYVVQNKVERYTGR
ncbi:MAG: alginate O-acetyltransferase AlgF [Gallionella sp.]|nr:alginate O-acetyltransferase AlgF [Gallionella sp.]